MNTSRFLLALCLILSTSCIGQKRDYKPFKMVILTPDTAIIDEGLKSFVDSIESGYVKRYYNSIKEMEKFLAFKDYPNERKAQIEETKRKLEESLKVAKQSEQAIIKEFKYFETIPAYSNSVLQMYFNEYPPNSTFQVVQSRNIETQNLNDIALEYGADYVVSYKNIHTRKLSDGSIAMNMTTILYARNDSEVLFEKKTVGSMNSYGDMWTCSDPLSCLLITSVKASTTEIFDAVSKRQRK